MTPLMTALQVADALSENPKTQGEITSQMPTSTFIIFTRNHHPSSSCLCIFYFIFGQILKRIVKSQLFVTEGFDGVFAGGAQRRNKTEDYTDKRRAANRQPEHAPSNSGC